MPRNQLTSQSRARHNSTGGLHPVKADGPFWEIPGVPPGVRVERKKSRSGGRRKKCHSLIPVKGLDAALMLPFTFNFRVGRGGGPDLQLKIFQFSLGALHSSSEPCGSSIPIDHGAGTFALQLGGVVMGQVLFPGAMSFLGRIFCTTGLMSLVLGKDSLVQKCIGRPWRRRQPSHANGALVALSSCYEAINALSTQLSLPLAVAFIGHLLWKRLHKRSHTIAESSVALMKVNRSYNRLQRSISAKQSLGQDEVEAMWLKAHKTAAQQVAHFLEDLPDRPPLEGVLDLWESLSLWAFLPLDRGERYNAFGLCEGGEFCFGMNMGVKKSRDQHELQDAAILQRRQGDSTGHHSGHPIPHRHLTSRHLGSGQGLTGGEASSSSEYSVWDSCVDAEQGPSRKVHDHRAGPSCSQEDVSIDALPLFGRADHSLEDATPLTAGEKVVLAARAVKLFCIFIPILLFGGIAVLLANALEQEKAKQPQTSISRGRDPAAAPEVQKTASSNIRTWASDRLLGGCRSSGAAFIKWGQWSATRGDLFPDEFCDSLSQLHDQAPVHSLKETKDEIHKAYGVPPEAIFEDFDDVPLASGSVAQVHRATIRRDDCLHTVVVKVRHPGVKHNIQQDFRILKPLAAWASGFSAMKGLPLKESVSQFSHTMTAQADLRVEAVHMQRMFENFQETKEAIVIPTLYDDLVTESVIVESFEEGRSVAYYIKNPSPVNTRIVALGVDAYLKMLLKDNLVHMDLHPGNILVREARRGGKDPLQIVLLDFGLVEEIRPNVRKNFISFLNMISKGDGRSAAQNFLQWSADQECEDPAAFTQEMVELFRREANVYSENGIDVDTVMKSVLSLSRKYRVSVDSSYAGLMISVCVLVGFATGLDPRVNIMDAATPVLLAYSLTGRVVGRIYG